MGLRADWKRNKTHEDRPTKMINSEEERGKKEKKLLKTKGEKNIKSRLVTYSKRISPLQRPNDSGISSLSVERKKETYQPQNSLSSENIPQKGRQNKGNFR